MKRDLYILSIDQSTSGTKALLFDAQGSLTARVDRAHRQIISEAGWVEHDPEEIYQNMLLCVREVLQKSGVAPAQVAAAGISNQRETGVMWARSGKPLYNAIVWQCARGRPICQKLEEQGYAPLIKQRTGLQLSPYFTAAKFHWMLHNVPAVQKHAARGTLLAGTMDSYLIYRLTKHHATDYSNASRTQLFNIHQQLWDAELCALFDVPVSALPRVRYSDDVYGKSTFEGIFETPILICGVLGDSHAALFAQGCIYPGMGKVTYGTGSSVMINTGVHPVQSDDLVTSLAWGIDKKIQYVLEGNINYTGAVFNWLIHDLELLQSTSEIEPLARSVEHSGGVYLVPAFSGLGAPYWDSNARALLCGMSRSTKKAHIVRAAEESIAYQITDILRAVQRSSVQVKALRADGGPTRDSFLMQFQADLLRAPLTTSRIEELSGAGAAFAAGLTVGLYTPEQLDKLHGGKVYTPTMRDTQAEALYQGWQQAVARALSMKDSGQ